MNAALPTALLVLLAITPALGACSASGSEAPPSELHGAWAGEGRVVVDWVERERLAVELSIDAAGAVTGHVGDARLVDARVRRNRGAFGRKLGWWTDWIVEGRLAGALLADEGFVATRTTLPFDLLDGSIDGGLHAWGRFDDGRRGGRLTAAQVRLQRR